LPNTRPDWYNVGRLKDTICDPVNKVKRRSRRPEKALENLAASNSKKGLVTMFSSISTMFWGEEQDGSSSNGSVPLPRRDESPAGDDWVLVGSSSPAPGDLGALEPLRTPASSTHSSNLPSSTVSEAGDEEEEGEPEPATTRVVNQRPNAAPSRLDALAMAEAKSLKLAQLEKQRNSGKTLSSKALKRTNKSRHADNVGKRANSKRSNFPIKMAGNRNLKQC